jgi:hypothetical protein
MAHSHLTQPVLAGNPQANCNSYIVGLLDELRQHIDALPVVPGVAVPVDSRKVMDLRGAFLEASIAIRNHMKWSA